MLTGEPYAVEKRPGPCTGQGLSEAFNALFGGTSIVSGEASMVVVATGAATRFGGIAAALNSSEPPTAFERGLHRFGVLILRLTGFLVLFVLMAHLAFGRSALELFLFAVALAVGLTPELLPDDRHCVFVAGCGTECAAQGDREAFGGGARSWRHGRALHGQDRHAHRARIPARRTSRRRRRRQRTG